MGQLSPMSLSLDQLPPVREEAVAVICRLPPLGEEVVLVVAIHSAFRLKKESRVVPAMLPTLATETVATHVVSLPALGQEATL